MKSQIVCAIGDSSDFYQKQFTPTPTEVPIPTKRYFDLGQRMKEFEWKTHLDEHYYFESDFNAVQPDGGEGIHAHNRKLLQRLRTGNYSSSDVDYMGATTKAYAVPLGHVWVGGRSGIE